MDAFTHTTSRLSPAHVTLALAELNAHPWYAGLARDLAREIAWDRQQPGLIGFEITATARVLGQLLWLGYEPETTEAPTAPTMGASA